MRLKCLNLLLIITTAATVIKAESFNSAEDGLRPSLSCILWGDAGCQKKCSLLCMAFRCLSWNPQCNTVFCDCQEKLPIKFLGVIPGTAESVDLPPDVTFNQLMLVKFMRTPVFRDLDQVMPTVPDQELEVKKYLYSTDLSGKELKQELKRRFPKLKYLFRRLRPRPLAQLDPNVSAEVLKQGINADGVEEPPPKRSYFSSWLAPKAKKIDIHSPENEKRIIELIKKLPYKHDIIETFEVLRDSPEKQLYQNICRYFLREGMQSPDGMYIVKPTTNPNELERKVQSDDVIRQLQEKIDESTEQKKSSRKRKRPETSVENSSEENAKNSKLEQPVSNGGWWSPPFWGSGQTPGNVNPTNQNFSNVPQTSTKPSGNWWWGWGKGKNSPQSDGANQPGAQPTNMPNSPSNGQSPNASKHWTWPSWSWSSGSGSQGKNPLNPTQPGSPPGTALTPIATSTTTTNNGRSTDLGEIINPSSDEVNPKKPSKKLKRKKLRKIDKTKDLPEDVFPEMESIDKTLGKPKKKHHKRKRGDSKEDSPDSKHKKRKQRKHSSSSSESDSDESSSEEVIPQGTASKHKRKKKHHKKPSDSDESTIEDLNPSDNQPGKHKKRKKHHKKPSDGSYSTEESSSEEIMPSGSQQPHKKKNKHHKKSKDGEEAPVQQGSGNSLTRKKKRTNSDSDEDDDDQNPTGKMSATGAPSTKHKKKKKKKVQPTSESYSDESSSEEISPDGKVKHKKKKKRDKQSQPPNQPKSLPTGGINDDGSSSEEVLPDGTIIKHKKKKPKSKQGDSDENPLSSQQSLPSSTKPLKKPKKSTNVSTSSTISIGTPQLPNESLDDTNNSTNSPKKKFKKSKNDSSSSPTDYLTSLGSSPVLKSQFPIGIDGIPITSKSGISDYPSPLDSFQMPGSKSPNNFADTSTMPNTLKPKNSPSINPESLGSSNKGDFEMPKNLDFANLVGNLNPNDFRPNPPMKPSGMNYPPLSQQTLDSLTSPKNTLPFSNIQGTNFAPGSKPDDMFNLKDKDGHEGPISEFLKNMAPENMVNLNDVDKDGNPVPRGSLEKLLKNMPGGSMSIPMSQILSENSLDNAAIGIDEYGNPISGGQFEKLLNNMPGSTMSTPISQLSSEKSLDDMLNKGVDENGNPIREEMLQKLLENMPGGLMSTPLGRSLDNSSAMGSSANKPLQNINELFGSGSRGKPTITPSIQDSFDHPIDLLASPTNQLSSAQSLSPQNMGKLAVPSNDAIVAGTPKPPSGILSSLSSFWSSPSDPDESPDGITLPKSNTGKLNVNSNTPQIIPSALENQLISGDPIPKELVGFLSPDQKIGKPTVPTTDTMPVDTQKPPSGILSSLGSFWCSPNEPVVEKSPDGSTLSKLNNETPTANSIISEMAPSMLGNKPISAGYLPEELSGSRPPDLLKPSSLTQPFDKQTASGDLTRSLGPGSSPNMNPSPPINASTQLLNEQNSFGTPANGNSRGQAVLPSDLKPSSPTSMLSQLLNKQNPFTTTPNDLTKSSLIDEAPSGMKPTSPLGKLTLLLNKENPFTIPDDSHDKENPSPTSMLSQLLDKQNPFATTPDGLLKPSLIDGAPSGEKPTSSLNKLTQLLDKENPFTITDDSHENISHKLEASQAVPALKSSSIPLPGVFRGGDSSFPMLSNLKDNLQGSTLPQSYATSPDELRNGRPLLSYPSDHDLQSDGSSPSHIMHKGGRDLSDHSPEDVPPLSHSQMIPFNSQGTTIDANYPDGSKPKDHHTPSLRDLLHSKLKGPTPYAAPPSDTLLPQKSNSDLPTASLSNSKQSNGFTTADTPHADESKSKDITLLADLLNNKSNAAPPSDASMSQKSNSELSAPSITEVKQLLSKDLPPNSMPSDEQLKQLVNKLKSGVPSSFGSSNSSVDDPTKKPIHDAYLDALVDHLKAGNPLSTMPDLTSIKSGSISEPNVLKNPTNNNLQESKSGDQNSTSDGSPTSTKDPVDKYLEGLVNQLKSGDKFSLDPINTLSKGGSMPISDATNQPTDAILKELVNKLKSGDSPTLSPQNSGTDGSSSLQDLLPSPLLSTIDSNGNPILGRNLNSNPILGESQSFNGNQLISPSSNNPKTRDISEALTQALDGLSAPPNSSTPLNKLSIINPDGKLSPKAVELSSITSPQLLNEVKVNYLTNSPTPDISLAHTPLTPTSSLGKPNDLQSLDDLLGIPKNQADSAMPGTTQTLNQPGQIPTGSSPSSLSSQITSNNMMDNDIPKGLPEDFISSAGLLSPTSSGVGSLPPTNKLPNPAAIGSSPLDQSLISNVSDSPMGSKQVNNYSPIDLNNSAGNPLSTEPKMNSLSGEVSSNGNSLPETPMQSISGIPSLLSTNTNNTPLSSTDDDMPSSLKDTINQNKDLSKSFPSSKSPSSILSSISGSSNVPSNKTNSSPKDLKNLLSSEKYDQPNIESNKQPPSSSEQKMPIFSLSPILMPTDGNPFPVFLSNSSKPPSSKEHSLENESSHSSISPNGTPILDSMLTSPTNTEGRSVDNDHQIPSLEQFSNTKNIPAPLLDTPNSTTVPKNFDGSPAVSPSQLDSFKNLIGTSPNSPGAESKPSPLGSNPKFASLFNKLKNVDENPLKNESPSPSKIDDSLFPITAPISSQGTLPGDKFNQQFNTLGNKLDTPNSINDALKSPLSTLSANPLDNLTNSLIHGMNPPISLFSTTSDSPLSSQIPLTKSGLASPSGPPTQPLFGKSDGIPLSTQISESGIGSLVSNSPSAIALGKPQPISGENPLVSQMPTVGQETSTSPLAGKTSSINQPLRSGSQPNYLSTTKPMTGTDSSPVLPLKGAMPKSPTLQDLLTSNTPVGSDLLSITPNKATTPDLMNNLNKGAMPKSPTLQDLLTSNTPVGSDLLSITPNKATTPDLMNNLNLKESSLQGNTLPMNQPTKSTLNELVPPTKAQSQLNKDSDLSPIKPNSIPSGNPLSLLAPANKQTPSEPTNIPSSLEQPNNGLLSSNSEPQSSFSPSNIPNSISITPVHPNSLPTPPHSSTFTPSSSPESTNIPSLLGQPNNGLLSPNSKPQSSFTPSNIPNSISITPVHPNSLPKPPLLSNFTPSSPTSQPLAPSTPNPIELPSNSPSQSSQSPPPIPAATPPIPPAHVLAPPPEEEDSVPWVDDEIDISDDSMEFLHNRPKPSFKSSATKLSSNSLGKQKLSNLSKSGSPVSVPPLPLQTGKSPPSLPLSPKDLNSIKSAPVLPSLGSGVEHSESLIGSAPSPLSSSPIANLPPPIPSSLNSSPLNNSSSKPQPIPLDGVPLTGSPSSLLQSPPISKPISQLDVPRASDSPLSHSPINEPSLLGVSTASNMPLSSSPKPNSSSSIQPPISPSSQPNNSPLQNLNKPPPENSPSFKINTPPSLSNSPTSHLNSPSLSSIPDQAASPILPKTPSINPNEQFVPGKLPDVHQNPKESESPKNPPTGTSTPLTPSAITNSPPGFKKPPIDPLKEFPNDSISQKQTSNQDSGFPPPSPVPSPGNPSPPGIKKPSFDLHKLLTSEELPSDLLSEEHNDLSPPPPPFLKPFGNFDNQQSPSSPSNAPALPPPTLFTNFGKSPIFNPQLPSNQPNTPAFPPPPPPPPPLFTNFGKSPIFNPQSPSSPFNAPAPSPLFTNFGKSPIFADFDDLPPTPPSFTSFKPPMLLSPPMANFDIPITLPKSPPPPSSSQSDQLSDDASKRKNSGQNWREKLFQKKPFQPLN